MEGGTIFAVAMIVIACVFMAVILFVLIKPILIPPKLDEETSVGKEVSVALNDEDRRLWSQQHLAKEAETMFMKTDEMLREVERNSWRSYQDIGDILQQEEVVKEDYESSFGRFFIPIKLFAEFDERENELYNQMDSAYSTSTKATRDHTVLLRLRDKLSPSEMIEFTKRILDRYAPQIQ